MNPIELDDLRQGLRDLADQPHPITTDIVAARSRGRRMILTRRALATGGTVLALGTAAFVVVPGSSSRPVPPATGVTETRGNPFVATASFGWLPTGWRIIDQGSGLEPDDQTSTVITQQGYSVSAQLVPQGNAVHQAILTLFRPGSEPSMGFMRGGVPAKPVPAKPVNGHPAHWLQPPPPGKGTATGEARLRIQLAPRQWAELEVNDVPPSGNVSALLYRIAEGIRLSSTPMAFPVQLRNLPAAFTPTGAVTDTEKSSSLGWATRLAFKPGLSVDISLHGETPSSTNTKINGYPAYYGLRAKGKPISAMPKVAAQTTYLCVYGVQALDVCLEADSSALAALKPVGGLPGLFKQMKVFGPAQSRWTTHPLG